MPVRCYIDRFPSVVPLANHFVTFRDGTGTLAAAFQSSMYGALTPPGGIFATLTSMAMLGTFMPMVVLIAALIATAVAAIVWKTGLGAK